MTNITVAGTGYVGLVTGVCLAEIGHEVTCVDNIQDKIDILNEGISPIFEPGLDELIIKNSDAGKLFFTTDYQNTYAKSDVIFIGVGTPENEDGSANLNYVYTVAQQIAKFIERDCLIVVKSTVPIGTNEKIEKLIKQHLKNDVQVEVASNPEFLAQGTAVRDTLYASRIVIGVESERARQILTDIYQPFHQPILTMNRRSAEMVKYASNDFLALKISFVNDIANLCEVVGANIEDVTNGMSYDQRIGDKFLNPGIGYGGSCFPKDTKALHWLSEEEGYVLRTIKAAIEVNEKQKFKLIKKARQDFATFKGLKVAVLGLTFKPGTDDLREAPSIPNIRLLLNEGAEVHAYDPVGVNNFKKIYPTQVYYEETIEKALKNADICFIFTEWEEIKNMNLNLFNKQMKSPFVYDGRNCYNLDEVKRSGINYQSIGRPNINGYKAKIKANV
ncbi:UDP-glucose dehydrogenase family protein [Priestia megaterium]|uniref:UDP-glucose 6-dehydrogenase n=1 Tax=Priestia megaterium (strain DSM 319 / IMG 1521) TaxID=592022 RepID=D5DBK1_PRIM3|nr:UDP-glucose/GDP-mannose dehydrogenase family protein [Priestia megaterium]ADF37983.1 UDP-glucose 6-dehydrogenase (UDP-Glc dehydrogenase)(UDP-GlcDH) (UDPGDH) (Teichuronic acid biosynthesis protein tuaD) [Priestia megaterium DSM 319]MED4217263.1 UDP-glucose/GDP-mannose dehydrogenase family protein [Priestia megaterium]WEZ37230.1 UDP-glucose/GDP-mannose dehydrogenase family protein [Priestia megaterium DSM 319]